MYEIRSLWVQGTTLTEKQKKSADFKTHPVIGSWKLGPHWALRLTDDEFLVHHALISKLVGCDCVKYRVIDPRETLLPKLCLFPESSRRPALPLDPTKPPG